MNCGNLPGKQAYRSFATGLLMLSLLVGQLSAQEYFRTGQGAATVEGYTLNGFLLGTGTDWCTSATCNALIVANIIGRFPSRGAISMADNSISISGRTEYTPNSIELPFSIGGSVSSSVGGTQSIYANVSAGTKFRVVLTGESTPRADDPIFTAAWVSFSTSKGGAFSGGSQSYTVVAGPPSIVRNGVTYQFVEAISASGLAAASGTHGYYHNAEFSGSIRADLQVLGTNLFFVSGGGSGPVGTRLDNPLTVRVINTETGLPAKVDINFEPQGASCNGFSADPNFTQTEEKHGVAKTYISLAQQPGTCVYRATCPACQGNRSVNFTVQAIARPELDLSGPDDGSTRTGGGPSAAGGAGSSSPLGPLLVLYGRSGKYIYTRPPDGGFVGLLTGDSADFKALLGPGSVEWRRDGLLLGSDRSITQLFGQERTTENPVQMTIRRAEDGKEEEVRVIVEQRPSGMGDTIAYSLSFDELCRLPNPALIAKCFRLKNAEATARKGFRTGRPQPDRRSGLQLSQQLLR